MNGTAYEVAVDFIRLGDIIRMWQYVGIEIPLAISEEETYNRHRLDVMLAPAPQPRRVRRQTQRGQR